MPSSKAEYRRYARLGPGGWKCACCTPASPGKMKPYLRAWKKRERSDAFKEAIKDLSADS